MSRYFAKRQLNGAMASRNGPDVTDVRKAPLFSKVLVYRTMSKSWEGPFRLLNADRETVTVQCPDGPQAFPHDGRRLFKEDEVPRVRMRITVYWPKDKLFCSGRITELDDVCVKHKVEYDDSDVEQPKLDTEICVFYTSLLRPSHSTRPLKMTECRIERSLRTPRLSLAIA